MLLCSFVVLGRLAFGPDPSHGGETTGLSLGEVIYHNFCQLFGRLVTTNLAVFVQQSIDVLKLLSGVRPTYGNSALDNRLKYSTTNP